MNLAIRIFCNLICLSFSFLMLC